MGQGSILRQPRKFSEMIDNELLESNVDFFGSISTILPFYSTVEEKKMLHLRIKYLQQSFHLHYTLVPWFCTISVFAWNHSYSILVSGRLWMGNIFLCAKLFPYTWDIPISNVSCSLALWGFSSRVIRTSSSIFFYTFDLPFFVKI